MNTDTDIITINSPVYVLITLILLLGFSAPVLLHGQSPYVPEVSEPLSETWRWKSLENLSTKGVRCMIDDQDGNMWFGLNNGIVRYDGYNWNYFDQDLYLQRPVTSLALTADGSLYAASESGLLKFTDETWQKVFPTNDTLHIPITCLTHAPDGKIFAGIQNGFIIIGDEQTIIFTILAHVATFRQTHPEAKVVILPDETLLNNRIFGRVDEIFIDKNDQIWMFMSRNNDGRLLRFSLKDTINNVLHKFAATSNLDNTPLSNRSQMIESDDGTKWIINGFYKSGILKKTGKKWEQIKLSDKFGGDELHTDIIELTDGSIWIGGLGKLFVLRNNEWKVFSAPALPIPSSRIIFHESRNGEIWIAGVQGDVFHINYNSQQWVKYQGLNFQFQDSKGKDWYISKIGEVVFNEGDQWYSYGRSDGVIDDPVRLIQTQKGTIWAAGSHNGIAATCRFSNGKWTHQIHPALSWGIDSRSVFQDRQGNLWFGASVDRQESLGQISGVLQLKNPDDDVLEWVHHTQKQGIIQHNVYGIGQSPDDFLWLGGTNLLRYSGKRWETLANVDYFNEFIDIVHSRQNLWVGSRYYGLFRFDGTNWQQFTKNQGLPSNTIISIFEENQESVWVITDKDIAWFDGNSWFEGMFPPEFRIPREGGELFVTNDGTIRINKALREWKRRAFPFSITHREALDDFWTVRYKKDTMPPKTHITVFSEKVDPAGNTFIGWTGNDFFEKTQQDLLTFSWRLNEGEWSDFSSETSVVLTNLNSGDYTFEVIARDLDANIETTPQTISFTVSPPIWKQAWFIILVVSFLLIIGYYEARLINRNRSLFKLNVSLTDNNLILEKRQKKIEEQKEKIQQQKDELEKKNIILEEKNTEILQSRDQLEQMVIKVEELSSVKQRFFTNISHEFRTPLTLILGSIEQLLNSQENDEKGKLHQAYETIQRSSRRILRLINQILEIRKIETGKLQLNPVNGDIVSFTREIAFLFNDMAKNQSLQFDFVCEHNAIPVMFDHDKIEKILFNLLSNAFKSTPPGGKIILSLKLKDTTQKSISPNDTGRIIEFELIDTGKGIPADEMEHIFDRFYQVYDPENNQKFAGSGIGLSYVKDLVQNHNGEIHVSSEPGKGSVFTFEIPAIPTTWQADKNIEMDHYNPSQHISQDVRQEVEMLNRTIDQAYTSEMLNRTAIETSGKKGKNMIMVVEDEDELRQFIRSILEPDLVVIEAVNGAMGYEHALTYQPDIIISDVMMPEMNGIELCSRLKSNLATNHIPVIMLTAQSAPENKLKGYQTGADAYIEKPFNMEFLRIRINNLIQAKEKTREKVLRDLITRPGEIAIHSEDEKMLAKIKDLLEENIANPDFDVESLSQEFYLSRFHFSRKIKQITGLSPKDIINSFRLKRAGQILQQNKLTVSEIAYMVGFDHPNSFTRAFRKYYNMTPSEFASQN
jgi:signal transduction histidine kinase/DNA-binding response OmpR family regulator/ligand-binding sensor domain-containing protein